MADVCTYKNKHGVKCGLPINHKGDHDLTTQLVPPAPFCIQPWDRNALATIRAWIVAAKAVGVPEAKIQKAEQHYREIERWQKVNGTKTPD